MKTHVLFTTLLFVVMSISTSAQEVQSIFGKGKSAGGYGAISNKFTYLGGEFANVSEVYGGVFVNRRWMLGLAFAGSTNNIQVPMEHSVDPLIPMTYQYGQGGLKVERVFSSNRSIHFVINMFSGVGFTAQYNRNDLINNNYNQSPSLHDENWFYVVEPGAQLEINLFRWMRLSPGISYRQTYGSNGLGLNDTNLSNWTYNVSLKFGGFGKRYREESHDRLN